MRSIGSSVWIGAVLVAGALVGFYFAANSGGALARTVGGATTGVAETSTASRPMEPQTLCVLTANIRMPSPEDVEDSWAKRRELLIKTLLAQEADIIGIQEATPAQTAYLLNNLKGYELTNRSETPNPVPGGGGGGGMLAPLSDMMGSLNQIYYRVDRFRLLAAEGGPLRPEAPQGNLTENTYYTLAVLADVQKAFANLIVVDTHLRHGDKNAEICAERIHRKIAQAKLKYPEAQVVLLGDMNHGRNSEVWQQLVAAKSTTPLRDTHDYAAMSPQQPWGTYHAFAGKPLGEWPIDLILVSAGLKAEAAIIVKAKDPETGHYPSDHFFVKTTIHPGKSLP